jgi:nucleotide-binding universal stress UspA family protein
MIFFKKYVILDIIFLKETTMFTPKNILVPTDFSAPSVIALDHAKDIARTYSATLHIVHAIEPIIYPAEWGFPSTEFAQAGQYLSELSGKELQKISEKLTAEGLNIKTQTLQGGSASSEIADYAAANNIDLIVIATHGRSGIEHFFLGSTTERVLRKAHCPVLTVRRKKEE